MSRIRILPDILSNKIAAGEVVERPSSVVKELVENALDANATRIRVELEQGGRNLVRVSDNGMGMNHDDALLALERFATSKLTREEDLFDIRTLGFRGEALPSIASVSRFDLVSRDAESTAGTRIEVVGGRIQEVAAVGAPPGTMISVAKLFFNVPARRKFLKTVGTEMGHIVDAVAGLALGWHRVQFQLRHNGRDVKQWAATQDPLDRVADVLGKGLKNDLHPLEFKDEHFAFKGWIASPAITRSTSRGTYVQVNDRLVRDRVIGHALNEGYAGRLMKGRYPLAILFIRVPPDQVDVNVHPTKHEIRFIQQKIIHDTIRRTVASTLAAIDRPAWTVSAGADSRPSPPAGRVIEAPVLPSPRPSLPSRSPSGRPMTEPSGVAHQPPIETALPVEPATPPPSGVREQSPLWERGRFGALRIIGQLHNTYIVCEADDGLVLIDQHAAHERILFERLQEQTSTAHPPAQKMLIPETLELGYLEADLLRPLLPALEAAGLEIEPFGGNTFAIKTLPALLAREDAGRMVKEMLADIAATGLPTAAGPTQARERCLELMACHGAIRAHQELSLEQLQALLDQLDRLSGPPRCPHGRPVWQLWTRRELEKAFKRVV